ncbi:alpha-D-phosphohexomutase superfamily protein, partial [Kipferlia bialata]
TNIVVLGRDSRESGPALAQVVIDEVAKWGLVCHNTGIVPTPTVQFYVQHTRALGGIMLTASHNPRPWNGLKLVGENALFLSGSRLEGVYSNGATLQPLPEDLPEAPIDTPLLLEVDAVTPHVQSVLAVPYMDVEAIRSANLKVAIDPICGAGGVAMRALLDALHVTVRLAVNDDQTGQFPRLPEPNSANLAGFSQAMADDGGCDMGIAQDPDADRYNSTRRPQDPPLTVLRTPVGEANVASVMVQAGSIAGGEGSGGVMIPDSHIGRDSLVAAGMALTWLARRRLSQPSAPFAELCQEHMDVSLCMVKSKQRSPSNRAVIAALKALATECRGDTEYTVREDDGLHISSEDWWLHVRMSNTEPIFRICGEATGSQAAEALVAEWEERMTQLVMQHA